MALDFTTGVLDSRVTIARLLNTATRFNASGLIEIVNANLPRFDYDSATLAPKGLLIEEARTNTLLYSEQLNDVIWSKTATVTADQLVSPDGTTTADLVSTTGNFQYVRQLIVATANAPYTVSFFVKPVSGSTTVRLYLTNAPQTEVAGSNFSLTGAGSLGTLFQTGTGVVTSRTVTQLANGWYRCTVSGTVNTTTLYGYIDNHSNGTMSFGVWGAQLEAGAFATSYIPTTTLAVLRNADVVSMTGTNFSDWYNSTQGTFFAQYSVSVNGAFPFCAVNSATPTTEVMYLRYNATQHQGVTVTGGANVSAIFDGTAVSVINNVKTAFAYKANAYGIRSNGGAGSNASSNSASGALPSGINKLVIGANQTGATGFVNGCIAKLSYYNISLLNGELSAVSK